ncbi:hypothetical protein [Seleniivibrio woodruffii]|uniref:hypothetical protein n=1 Tax=Seleniivibrio woodruffii TaxID=1078050 RepID=UPI0026ECFA1A|nr:hypothetical protein [Seleniivibrio woodruffii]
MEISGSNYASSYIYSNTAYKAESVVPPQTEDGKTVVIMTQQTEQSGNQSIANRLEEIINQKEQEPDQPQEIEKQLSDTLKAEMTDEEYIASLEKKMEEAKTQSLDKLAELLQLPDKNMIDQVDTDDVEDFISMFKIKYIETGDARPVFNKTFDNVEDFWNYKLKGSSAENPQANGTNSLRGKDQLYMDGHLYKVTYVDESNTPDGNKLLKDANPAALQQLVKYWDEGSVGQLNESLIMTKAMKPYSGVYDASQDTSAKDAFWNRIGKTFTTSAYGTYGNSFFDLMNESYMASHTELITNDFAFLEFDMNDFTQNSGEKMHLFQGKRAVRI